MALTINGTNIPTSGKVVCNGTSLKEFRANGVLVWTSTPDPVTIMKTGSSIGSWMAEVYSVLMQVRKVFP